MADGTEGQKAPMPEVESTLKEEKVSTHRIKPLYRSTQIIWYIVGILESLLILRFFLKLLGANPEAGFSQFIYGATWLFASPFLYVFNVSQIERNIFEWSTLLAMFVYFLIGWAIVKGIVMSRPVTTEEARKELPKQEKV